MKSPAIRLFADMAIADNFAGGGGASEGIKMALGRDPDVAINHDREALAMHLANHPTTHHIPENVFDVDPVKACGGRRCALAWFSPDCTYHSKAKGGVPFRDKHRARRIRGLAWVMLRWAQSKVKPVVIFMENVEEIADWGPLMEVRGGEWVPNPARRGQYWRQLVGKLQAAGYVVEWRELKASEFGAPTSRKRLFLIARCDKQPIVWPKPSHGKPTLPVHHRLQPFRTAAECIDFSLPVPSIFMTQRQAKAWGKQHGVPAPRRPLAAATLRRIARGVYRFVLNAANPFIVPVMHQGDDRCHSVHEPLRTITTARRGEFALATPFIARIGQTGGNGIYCNDAREPVTTITTKAEHLLVAPTLIQTSYGERKGQQPRTLDLFEPLGTVVAGGIKHSLVATFLAKHNGGHEATGQVLSRPMDTVVCRENKALVAACLTKFYGTCEHGQALDGPMPSVTAHGNHIGAVYAFLMKYFGTKKDGCTLFNPLDTVTTKARYGLVTVTIGGDEYLVVDIGMRMLAPRELYLAQGFPPSYEISHGVDIETHVRIPFTKQTQIRLVGNSVPPHLAAAIIRANCRAIEEAVA